MYGIQLVDLTLRLGGGVARRGEVNPHTMKMRRMGFGVCVCVMKGTGVVRYTIGKACFTSYDARCRPPSRGTHNSTPPLRYAK